MLHRISKQSTKCTWAPPFTKVQQHSTLNVVMRSKLCNLWFLPGLPQSYFLETVFVYRCHRYAWPDLLAVAFRIPDEGFYCHGTEKNCLASWFLLPGLPRPWPLASVWSLTVYRNGCGRPGSVYRVDHVNTHLEGSPEWKNAFYGCSKQQAVARFSTTQAFRTLGLGQTMQEMALMFRSPPSLPLSS